VAVLGVGGVKMRPVVIETQGGDIMAIRSMCVLSLTLTIASSRRHRRPVHGQGEGNDSRAGSFSM
jgi:hypothetical protein